MAWNGSSSQLRFSQSRAAKRETAAPIRRGVWRHLASEIMPFRKRYELDLGHEEIISLDYNSAKKNIRIGIKSGAEEFYAIIKNGQVLRQRNQTSESDIDFEKIVSPYIRNIESLPNTHVLGLIDNNFGISRNPVRNNGAGSDVYISPWLLEKRGPRTFGENLFWFFFGRFPRRRRKEREPFWPRFKRRYKGDFTDIFLATGLALAFLWYWVDYWKIGATLAFFGFLTGLIDWRLRKRNPLLSKIFVISGPASYLFVWAWLYT